MNFYRLEQVKAAIIANSDKYDQSTWLHNCGTPACIAGWAASLSLQDDESLAWYRPTGPYGDLQWDQDIPLVTNSAGEAFDIAYRARKWLWLSGEEAETMFDSDPLHDGRIASPDDAVAMLDHAIETGNVVWGIDSDV